MTTDRKDDQVFDDYLQGDSDLSRHYRESQRPEPPKHLDNAILSAARASVNKPAGNLVRLIPRKWYRPVAKAALLFICVGLLLTLYETEDQRSLVTIPDTQFYPGTASPVKGSNETGTAGMANENISDRKPADAKAGDTNAPAKELLQHEDSVPAPAELNEMESGQPVISPASKNVQGAAEPGVTEHILKRERVMHDAAPAAANLSNQTESRAREMLRNISELWQAGKRQEAVSSLEQFLENNPDYPKKSIIEQLPDDFVLPDRLRDVETE